MTPTVTAFASSPDCGWGLARDIRVRWACEEVGPPYGVRLQSFANLKSTAHRARTTLMQLARTAGFCGRIAVTSHSARDTKDLLEAGADVVLEPFQDAADRAVEIICGSEQQERTDIPLIETEEKPIS